MSSNICPSCDEEFSASSTARNHAWDEHDACYHCGEQFGDKEALYTHWLQSHPDALSRIDRKRAESTVDSSTFTERLSNKGVGAAVSGLQRRTFLLAGAAVIGGAGAVGTTLLGNDDSPSDRNQSPGQVGDTGAFKSVPIPSSPEDYRYPATGTGDADATVTYFGSWKCPYCAQFSIGFLSTLITDYVETGKITIKFRNLAYINGEPFLGPDAPAAARAGLAVWNEDPKSYWSYHEYTFRNQPPESKRWATVDTLTSFAREAGVTDPSVIRTAIQENKYEDTLRATSNAAAEADVQGTPALLVDGTTVSPFEEDRTRQLIEEAIA